MLQPGWQCQDFPVLQELAHSSFAPAIAGDELPESGSHYQGRHGTVSVRLQRLECYGAPKFLLSTGHQFFRRVWHEGHVLKEPDVVHVLSPTAQAILAALSVAMHCMPPTML